MSVFDWIIAWMPHLAMNMVWGCLVGAGVYFVYRAFSGKSDSKEQQDKRKKGEII